LNGIKVWLGVAACILLAANAFAGTTTLVGGIVTYAREAATGGTLYTMPIQTVTRQMGVVRSSTADFFVIVSLEGVVFASPTLPTVGSLTLTDAAGGAATITVVSGGGNGESSITYFVDVTTSFTGLPTFTFTTTGLTIRDSTNVIGTGGVAFIKISTTNAASGGPLDVGSDSVSWLTSALGVGDALLTATTAVVNVSGGRLNFVPAAPDTGTNDNGAGLTLSYTGASLKNPDGTAWTLSTTTDSVLLALIGPLSGVFSWTWNPEAGGGGTAVTHLVTDEEIAAGQSVLTISGTNLNTVGTGLHGIQITVTGTTPLSSRTLKLNVFLSTAAGTRTILEPSTLTVWTLNGSVLLANWVNGNTALLTSNIYVWNPTVTAGEITLRLFSLPTGTSTPSNLLGSRSLGFLKPTSGLNIRIKEDVLQPLGLPVPYTDNGGNLVLEVSIEAVGCSGYAQTVGTSNTIVFGTTPLSVAR